MTKDRLLAFSDGVIAILITIMVLELKKPDGADWQALRDDVPILLAYVLSFVNVGIYWNNHHHMLSVVHRVSGLTLWLNMHLLFWLSLVPFTTDWMSETDFATVPVVAYGVVLLAAGIAYYLLAHELVRVEGADSLLANAVGRDVKGKISPALYVVAIPLTFLATWIGLAIYIAVALMWFVPDRRVERVMAGEADAADAA